ncbi:hypothetical protein SEA_PHONEGINGI_66 [Microbacterium phage Phonegingi]|nr:hypothetical protein SEA_PHONEGINGI_66 [Microbacterium phage Phonegingi]
MTKRAGGQVKTDAITCAWVMGGHIWRLRARWDWANGRADLVGERCRRCDIERPVGGWLSLIRRALAVTDESGDCASPRCGYPEPHRHGFACERGCECGESMQRRDVASIA